MGGDCGGLLGAGGGVAGGVNAQDQRREITRVLIRNARTRPLDLDVGVQPLAPCLREQTRLSGAQ